MKNISTALLVFFPFIAFSIAAQERATEPTTGTLIPIAPAPTVTGANPSPSSLLGTWRGRWESNGRNRYNNSMEMEILTVDGNRIEGQIKVGTSAACSTTWVKLVGTKSSEEKLFAQYDLGGSCGKADLVLSIDPARGVISGTYSSEYPDKGKVTLSRQR